MKTFLSFLKRLFCFHDWICEYVSYESEQRLNGYFHPEVRTYKVAHYKCTKCGAEDKAYMRLR